LSIVDASALYPSAEAAGSDSDNIGAESDQATDDILAVAITMALFPMNARREKLMDVSFMLGAIGDYDSRPQNLPPGLLRFSCWSIPRLFRRLQPLSHL
jgi:hypothetical protein